MQPDGLKVLFALTAAYLPEFTGGIESSIHESCTQLRERGVEVAVLARFRKRGGRARRHALRRLIGLDAAVAADDGLGYPTLRCRRPLEALPEACRRVRPDVAVIQRGRLGQLSRSLLDQGVPVVAYLHNATFDPAKDEYPDHAGVTYVANSRFTAAAFEARFGMPAEVVHPLVQPDWYRVESSREVVTFVNPTPLKGVEVALALAAARPDIPFAFVESWPLDRRTLRSLRREVQGLGNVALVPRTEDMRRVYGRSRLVLMPTRIDEAWGRVVTEAQVSGIPAIAVDRGGLPEAVGPGGILVDPAAPVSAWAEALGSLWDDPSAYAAACDAARAHAARPDIQVDAVMDRFIAILARHATAGRSAKAGPGGGR
jgi:glycosyltransferase involved in cell wall biosynthesis